MTRHSPRLRQNNFDLIRLLLALAVCLLHAHELSGVADLSIIDTLLSGKIAIESFFVISGFIMVHVIDPAAGAVDFYVKRIIRIVPLYWLLTLLLFAVGALIGTQLGLKWLPVRMLRHALGVVLLVAAGKLLLA